MGGGGEGEAGYADFKGSDKKLDICIVYTLWLNLGFNSHLGEIILSVIFNFTVQLVLLEPILYKTLVHIFQLQ